MAVIGRFTRFQGRLSVSVVERVPDYCTMESELTILSAVGVVSRYGYCSSVAKGEAVDWDAIGAVGEIVGAIAVVATLGYLARQMRQANLHAKSQARQRMIEQTQDELYQIVNDPSIHELFVRDGSLEADEQVKLNAFLASFMRQREWEWLQYRDGILDGDAFRSYYSVIPLLLGTERTRLGWERIGKSGFDQAFVDEVDVLLRSEGLLPYMYEIRSWNDAPD